MRLLRHRGFDVGVQNYIDDTGVQVADVVVGFLHLEQKTLADLERIPGQFDYYCWDLYARVGEFYAAQPENKALQAEALHAIEAGGNDTARLAEHVARRIVDCHLATMARLGIRYELLAHESDILRLHFWDRAFELLREKGAVRLETEGKNQGCWVLPMAEGESEAIDEDKIIVRSNGTVTYTGKDIAYQLWKLGKLDRDFRYRVLSVAPDGERLWTTTSGEGEPGAPHFGHASAVYNVIDVGQSYPQRVVRAGVQALGHEQGAEGSHHLAYEKVVLSPATARALGYEVKEEDTSVKVSGRKGLGVKADDLLDALVAKARAEVDARDPERDAGEREATARAVAVGALRYFMLRFSRTRIITFDMEEALAFTGETGPYLQNAVVRARNIFGKLAAEGHERDSARRPRALARPRRVPDRRGGRPGLVAAAADGAQRRGGGAGDRGLRTWRSSPSTPSPWRRRSTPTTRSPSTRCCTPRARTCARAARSWWTRSCARWKSCWACSGSRSRSGCDARGHRDHARGRRPAGLSLDARRLRPLGGALGRRARWCCRRCAAEHADGPARPPRRPGALGRRRRRSRALRAAARTRSSGASTASGTTSSWRSRARPCDATCRSSPSAGDSRC